MRCNQCGTIVRPVVCVDIDGTLGDYHGQLFKFVCDYYDLGRSSYEHTPWDGSGNFEDFIGISQERYRVAKLAFRQGGMKRMMPVYPGAQQFMDNLRSDDVEIWITTTRPWQRLDGVDPDTQEWLRRNDIPYDHLLYDDHKYRKVAEVVGADRIVGVIDDLPEMIDEARDVGLPTWQVRRSHNSDVRQRRTGGSLKSAYEWVTQNLRSWYEQQLAMP